jgi:SPP1 gp7 family putative phage head morphogenesis protein
VRAGDGESESKASCARRRSSSSGFAFSGVALIEFKMGKDGLIGDSEVVPRQHVKPEKGLITQYAWGDDSNAIHYRDQPYSYYILETCKPKVYGMFMNIAPYVLIKRQNLGDFSRFNEMFGMPLRVYEYDPISPDSREGAVQAAEQFGSSAYIVVPKGTNITFPEANKSGAQETYSSLHSILNDEITIGILGQKLTTSSDGKGSYALGTVQQQVERSINLEDRLSIEYLINYTMKNNILIPHGYPLEGIKGKFIVPDELPTEKKADMWVKLSDAGLPIAQKDFYNEFGVPMPGDNDPVIVGSKSADPGDEDQKDTDDPGSDPAPKDKQPGGAGKKKQEGAGNNPSLKLSNSDKSLVDMISNDLRILYANQCGNSYKSMSLSYKGDLQDIIDRIIADIHSGKIQPGDVDPELYELVSAELFKGVEKGFDARITKLKPGPDLNMLKSLQTNVYVFSAFKDYHFLREATDKLFDPTTGSKRSFSEFKGDILKLNEKYNVDWLRTEYNNAIASSRMASKWLDIQKDKELYPYLQYITAGDARVRVSHRPLDGITKHIDDPFWDIYYPPNDWNCRCTVKQVDEYNKETQQKTQNLPELKDMFKMNSGKQRIIFPKSHPYFKVLERDRGRADNNFGLTLPS